LVNDIDRENFKCYDKNLFQCHFTHHKSHVDWQGLGSEPLRRLTVRALARPPCFICAFFVFWSQFQIEIVYTYFEYFEPIVKAEFLSIIWDEVCLKISPEIWKGQISYFPISCLADRTPRGIHLSPLCHYPPI
jgi:hypothetical protein